MNKINFYFDEKKYVRLRIHSSNNEFFYIKNASWKLFTMEKHVLKKILHGECEIDVEKKMLNILLEPCAKGIYLLEVVYSITNERFKEKVKIEVI